MRRANPGDYPVLLAFLEGRAGTSMFALNSLGKYGLKHHNANAMRYWVDEKDGVLSGAIGISQAGIVMPQAPECSFSDLRMLMGGRTLTGMIGDAAQIDQLEQVFDCADWPCRLNTCETLYALDLDALVVPQGDTTILPIAKAPLETMFVWLRDYLQTSLGRDAASAIEMADLWLAAYCAEKSHVVLMDGDRPLAMTGFNALHKRAVQVGGVYTPAENRGRGYARRAVALQLDLARKAGFRLAYLCTDNPSAQAAYEAIGFRPIGKMRLVEFEKEHIIHG